MKIKIYRIFLNSSIHLFTRFLWCYQLEWLSFFQIHIYKWNGFCQIFTWLSNVCSVLSVWLVVAFTVERFVAVHYPLRRKSLCTVQRARCVIFYLILFHGICCSPLFYLAVSVTALKQETMEPEIQCGMDQSLKVSNPINVRILFYFQTPDHINHSLFGK